MAPSARTIRFTQPFLPLPVGPIHQASQELKLTWFSGQNEFKFAENIPIKNTYLTSTDPSHKHGQK